MSDKDLAFPGRLIARGPSALALLVVVMLLAILVPGRADAQNRVLDSATLTDLTTDLDLGRYTIIQDDPDRKVSAATIRSTRGSVLNGRMSRDSIVGLGTTGGRHWLSVKIFNQGYQKDWVIDLGRRIDGRLGAISSLGVYELSFDPPDAGGRSEMRLTELKPLQDKGVFKISIDRNQQKLILLNTETRAGLPVLVPLKIYREDAYLAHVQWRATATTFYLLALGALAFFFFANAVIRQRRSYSLYGGYFLFNIGAWVAYDNFGSMIGAGALPYFIALIMLGYAGFSVFLTRSHYNIGYSNFTEKYILNTIFFLNIAASVLALVLPAGDGWLHSALIYGAPILTFAIICLMSLAQARTGPVPGLYYCLGWLLPLAGYLIGALSLWGILPHDNLCLLAFWIALPAQGIALAIAVRQKILAGGEEDRADAHGLVLDNLKQTKDSADHSRLLKVIDKEREMLAEFRAREAHRTEEMRIAKEQADEANRAKSAFLAVVSHEIRTPMTGVMGMVRLLLESNISKQQRDYVMAIQESSDAMLALLNDILDFEKIQQGKIDVENISFDLHRLIQGVVTLMSGHAAEKNITLVARMDDNIPKYIKGDPTRLRQVLLNLMGNAIKFTAQGSVSLYVKNLVAQDAAEPGDDGRLTIYFAVQDSGIGISSEAQKNLFSPFNQANNSIARRFGGTGLGLAISKGLIERMGSAININSKEGEGSTFFFTLDTERGLSVGIDKPAAETPAVNREPSKPLKIMVVDDNAITRKVVAGFLEPAGHVVTGCDSAETALSRIYTGDYDLVLMDIELPNMKGNEATKLLREYGDAVRARVPVIAMTGNVGKDDMQTYLADGMSGFIAKPIDPDTLKSIVNEIGHKTFEREIKVPGAPASRGNAENPPAPALSPPLTPTAPPPTTSSLSGEEREKIFNPAMLQSLKDTIGTDSLNDLLGDLIAKTDEILGAMVLAVDNADFAGLAARAHELKGMAGNFGLVEVSEIAAQAERRAKSGDTGDLDQLVATLPGASTRAQEVLKDWVAA